MYILPSFISITCYRPQSRGDNTFGSFRPSVRSSVSALTSRSIQNGWAFKIAVSTGCTIEVDHAFNDFNINVHVWCILFIYRIPKYTKDKMDLFYTELKQTLDKIFVKYDNVILKGDFKLNTDLLDEKVLSSFTDIISAFDLSNLVTDPTCFKNINKPSKIDLMITNRPGHIKTTGTLDTPL